MSLTKVNLDITQEIQKIINDQLEKELSKEFDEAVKRFNSRKNEMISGIILSTQKQILINRAGEEISFIIKEIRK